MFSQAYDKLQLLIKTRQQFEKEHPIPPYSLYPTDSNFYDIHGNALLHYAAMLGDLDKLKSCLANGTDLNLKTITGKNALEIALAHGHLEAAKHLFDAGIRCEGVELAVCQDASTKHWFSEKMVSAIKEAYPEPEKNCEYPLLHNQFFSPSFSVESSAKLFHRAAEIGDLSLMQNAMLSLQNMLAPNVIVEGRPGTDSLLITAAKNGQLEMVKFLIAQKVLIDGEGAYNNTALMKAIQHKQHHVVNYLLTLNVDINKKDFFKNNALTYALIRNDKTLFQKLIFQGSEIAHTNVFGDNLLHIAAAHDVTFWEEILALPDLKGLAHETNIYGFTPLDIALQNKNMPALTYLSTSKDLQTLKKDTQFGQMPVAIAQSLLNEKIYFYLRTQYRDVSLFNLSGNCNGYSPLKELYDAGGNTAEYFYSKELMVSWNGEMQTLKQMTFLQDDQDLENLYEYFSSNLIWLQHSNLSSVDNLGQDDREMQFATVLQDQGIDYLRFYKESDFYESLDDQMVEIKRTEAQVKEMLFYCTRLPCGSRFEIRGGEHATTGNIDENGECHYYDSNFKFKIENPQDLPQLLQKVIDWKYIYTRQYHDKFACHFSMYTFKKDFVQSDLTHFEIFSKDQLPKNQEAARVFQANSPNQFSPLHVALMTGSLASLKQLLLEGHCDINAKDVFGRSIIKIALDANFIAAFKLILAATPHSADLDKLAAIAYKNKQTEILALIINRKDFSSASKLFFAAIENSDDNLIDKLVKENKVDINAKVDDKLPLLVAIEKEEVTLVYYLLKHGAKVTSLAWGNYKQETALSACMFQQNPALRKAVCAALTNINELDENGYAAIHYAAKAMNVHALAELIQMGANINLLTPNQESVLDCIDLVLGEDERAAFKLIVSTYQFDLNSPKEVSWLKQQLQGYAYSEDDDLFKILLDRCNLAVLNTSLTQQVITKGDALLHFLIKNNRYSKTKLLLDRGASVDLPLSNGLTPLLAFIILIEGEIKYQFIRLFLNYRPNLEAKDNAGLSVIDHVLGSSDDKLKTIFIERDLLPVCSSRALKK